MPMGDHATERHLALLCFDGSDDAASAIASAGRLIGPGRAVVLIAWNPATALSAPLARLIAKSTGFDELAEAIAHDKAERGTAIARTAGFDAGPRVSQGAAWETICQVADELDTEPIVIGSRGLNRARSALLGSVSQAVIAHTGRTALVHGRHPSHLPTTRSPT
jgi:nucleotide-binding universal stress UspA family protein